MTSETFGQLCERIKREGVGLYFKKRFACNGGKEKTMSDYQMIVQGASDQLHAILGYRTDSIDVGIGVLAKEIARLRAEVERLKGERDEARHYAKQTSTLANVHEARAQSAEAALAEMREKVLKIADGDYDRVVAKEWRNDGKP